MNIKRIIFLVVVFGGLMLAGVFYLEKRANSDIVSQLTPTSNIHLFGDPSVSLENIRLKMFYIVPNDQQEYIDSGWEKLLRDNLEKMAEFHIVQFRDRSSLKYDIYPEPIILENDSIFYNTSDTSGGNPRALVPISEEIERRVFIRGGDRYDEQFSNVDPNEHLVYGFLYEGVGASGGLIYESDLDTAEEIAKSLGIPNHMVYILDISSANGFFLISRFFFNQDSYEIFGSSVMYHEFAHTIGLPDTYEPTLTSDIMGTGRFRPLEINYIDDLLTRKMGLFE